MNLVERILVYRNLTHAAKKLKISESRMRDIHRERGVPIRAEEKEKFMLYVERLEKEGVIKKNHGGKRKDEPNEILRKYLSQPLH